MLCSDFNQRLDQLGVQGRFRDEHRCGTVSLACLILTQFIQRRYFVEFDWIHSDRVTEDSKPQEVSVGCPTSSH